MNYLKKAIEELTGKKLYFTPHAVIAYIENPEPVTAIYGNHCLKR